MASYTFATFKLNDNLFGLDITLIREINKQLDLTRVPHAPEYIRGLVNLRGQIVTVLDVNQRLGFGYSKLNEESHNIILKTQDELAAQHIEDASIQSSQDKIGLLVDDIQDIMTVSIEEIEQPPANMGALDGQFLSGVIRQQDTLLGILNITPLLSANTG